MFEALYTGKYVGAAMRLLLTAVPRESWVCMRVAKSCMYPCKGAGFVCVIYYLFYEKPPCRVANEVTGIA